MKAYLVILAVLLVSCTPKEIQIKTVYSGDFPVLQMRTMWAVCSQSFNINSPYLSSPVVAEACDCYVDYMRKNYSSKGVSLLTESESKEVGTKLSTICISPGGPSI
mgnify:CR=1 FL=1|jgi:hypothetical protein